VVEVRDDGRGITPRPTVGVGLVSMGERTAEVGGRLEVERDPNGGTIVRARLPVGPR
jgi:signal transduction histidine kinase